MYLRSKLTEDLKITYACSYIICYVDNNNITFHRVKVKTNQTL